MSEEIDWSEQSLSVKLVSDFMKKEEYVGKKYRAKIMGSNMGQFQKPVIHLLVGEKQVQCPLSVQNQNWLVRNLSKKPKEWINQVVFFTCVPIAFTDREGKSKSGHSIEFSLE